MCLDCSPGYDPRDDRPSDGDLAEMAADDAFRARRQAERDDAARARGEYVPDPTTRMLLATLRFYAPRGVDVEAVRRLVYRLDGPLDVEAFAAKIGPAYDVQTVDGITWARPSDRNELVLLARREGTL